MKDPVLQDGDPVLRHKAGPVAKKDIGSPALARLIDKMKKTLTKEEYGVAIAAPQVGESLRLFVIAGRAFNKPLTAQERAEQAEPEKNADKIFINPELVRKSRKLIEMSEGCLSVRGKYGTVLRHEKATVKALDETGKPFTYHATGLIAHIFQHECDHLEGILYIDKAVSMEDDPDWKKLGAKARTK